MLSEDLIELSLSQFKRACRVDRSTLVAMVDVLRPHLATRRPKYADGRKSVASDVALSTGQKF